MISRTMKVAVVAAAVSGFFASASVADECDNMTKSIKKLVDVVDPDKAGSNPALRCAIFAEALGMMKVLRTVAGECYEGDTRANTVAELSRTIRSIQSNVDKNCQ